MHRLQQHTPCLALVATATILLLSGCWREDVSHTDTTSSTQESTYLGRDACLACHQAEFDAHAGSHHDLAMQPATAETVLGDFDNAEFVYFGVVSRFFTRDGNFYIKTDSPDGGLREYRVEYTFGVDPLQQYLVALPGGRLQALPLCWDTRPRAEGGQRWFHLYPDEAILPGDELHWTGRNQNWNFSCAECHSTNLHKGYDLSTDTFHTTWSEVDVSCEACHGPGSGHVAWAEEAGEGANKADALDAGLVINLPDEDGGKWRFLPGAPTAVRSTPRSVRTEVEMCARCHSLRAALTDEYQHGAPILDSHRVSLLTAPEYFPDGQVLEEDYVYGSFLQSRMYAAGVTCTDCHDPHTAQLRATGDALCFQCHQPTVFGVESHSRHPSAGGVDSAGRS